METRYYQMFIRTPGGNASKNAKGYQVSIPSKWAQEMGIKPDDRTIKLTFDGSSITITKSESFEQSPNNLPAD